MIIDPTTMRGAGLAIGRAPGMPRFTDADVARLELYMPHLRAATTLMLHRVRERSANATLLAAFDEVDVASLVVDRFRRIHFANRAARELLAQADGVVRVKDKLVAADKDADTTLREAVFDLATAALRGEPPSRGDLVLPRRDAPFPLRAVVSPLSAETADLFEGGMDLAWAAVYLTDPAKQPIPSSEDLRRVYGLTPSEADIARRFGIGESVRTIAEDSKRSTETVRWHLKQSMDKVGVTRQADFVRILSALGPGAHPRS